MTLSRLALWGPAALIVLLASVSAQPPPGSKWNCVKDKDFDGKLINTVPVADSMQCTGVCTTTPGCKAVVIVQDPQIGTQMCRLMGGILQPKTTKGSTACTYEREGGNKKPLPPRPPEEPLPMPENPPDVLPKPFDPVSVRNPVDEGYPTVKREANVSPRQDLLCFDEPRRPPTNKWWAPATFTPGPIGKNYVTQLPYVLNIIKNGMEVSYPWIMAQGHIVQNIVNRHWMVDAGGASSYCVKRADEVSFTVKWGTTMESTILHGSPYMTMKYTDAPSPSIGTLQGIRSFTLDGEEVPCNGTKYTGHKFSAVLRDSDEQWVVWVPPGTTMKCQSSPASYFLTPKKGFSGIIRMALVNNCTTGLDNVSPHCAAPNVPNVDNDPYIADYEAALDVGSNVCTEGAILSADHISGMVAVAFHFKNHRCWPTLPRGLMTMIALPHHLSLLPCDGSARVILSGGHFNTRGHSLAVQITGHVWWLLNPPQPIPWIGPADSAKIPTIMHYLKGRGNDSDAAFDLPWDMQKGMIDPYNAGKLLSKMARIVLIADKLGEPEIADNMLDRLRRYLSTWLDHKTKNLLVYDQSWGGLISCGCQYIWIEQKWTPTGGYPICANNESRLECPTLKDPNFDFGNAYYNDHHFHYGYFIYSAAVVAKFDPDWAKRYHEKVLVLVRDIANPGPSDPYFTRFRYFDWYVGHSWALGIVADPNGKNQESTSEAVNAWYGIYLYGLATQTKLLMQIGEAMMLMEIHSTNYYWHVPPNQEIYPKQYKHTMVGILHDLLVEFQTYFGQQGFFVHGIQLLPITPVVPMMFHPGWVQTALPDFKKYCEGDPFCTQSGFVSFYYAEWALLDKEAAWEASLKLPDAVFGLDCAGGNGNSRTNLLYFISAWGNFPKPVWPSDKRRCLLPTRFGSNPRYHGTVLPTRADQGKFPLAVNLAIWATTALLVGLSLRYGHRMRHFYALHQTSLARAEGSPLLSGDPSAASSGGRDPLRTLPAYAAGSGHSPARARPPG
eukprot:RCo023166